MHNFIMGIICGIALRQIFLDLRRGYLCHRYDREVKDPVIRLAKIETLLELQL